MAKQIGKSKRVKEQSIGVITGGMNVAKNKMDLDSNEVQILENMEFDIDGRKLRTRRGLGSPLYTFDSDVLYVWNDYQLNKYIIFLKNKNVYTYEVGKTPILIGQINGAVDNQPSVCRFYTNNGTKVLIASGSTLQIYDYSKTTIDTDASYPECDTVMERFSRVVVSKKGSNNLKYSGIGDPTNWTKNTNDLSACKAIDVGDAAGIDGVIALSTDLLILKDNGRLYRIANEPEDWNVTMVGEGSDFLTKDALTILGSNAAYYSRQGLRSLETSETYGNFTSQELGVNCNPLLKKSFTRPFIAKLDRSNQLLVSPDSGTTIFCYHYDIKAFTRWIFPLNISSVAEGKEATIVGAGKSLYNLSYDNHVDVVDGVSNKIHQIIQSRLIWDNNIMTVYRTHVCIDSDDAGSAKISINDISWNWDWTKEAQHNEFKTQIRSDMITAKFETDDIIVWDYMTLVLVYQYVSYTSTTMNDKSSGSSWTKTKWGQGTFGEVAGEEEGSPYGDL